MKLKMSASSNQIISKQRATRGLNQAASAAADRGSPASALIAAQRIQCPLPPLIWHVRLVYRSALSKNSRGTESGSAVLSAGSTCV